ncbi:MAG: hypothetical protein HQL45_02950 [Alphaproteobacteria bacterium]|nr:hypothetical protein [Alphaproteobacteria bacterium]
MSDPTQGQGEVEKTTVESGGKESLLVRLRRWVRLHPRLSLLALASLGIWWWMQPASFPVRITVELEYQGKPVTISRVNRCVAWSQGHGIGGGSYRFWSWKYWGMGEVLPDGSAVFMTVPNACPYITMDEDKTGRAKYGAETVQPVSTFVPEINWTPDAKNIETFEQYYLKEAVTEPGSRIIYKGTKAERLRFYPLPVLDDGFSWYTGPDELTAYGETSDFLTFFLVPIPEEEWRKYPEVVEYLKKQNSERSVSSLPFDVYVKMKDTFLSLHNHTLYMSFADLKRIAEDEFLLYGGGVPSPAPGMWKYGDYGGTLIRDKQRLMGIDSLLPLKIEGKSLKFNNERGVFYRKRYDQGLSQQKTTNKWSITYLSGVGEIKFYAGAIYIPSDSKMFIFMTHALGICSPHTTCKTR